MDGSKSTTDMVVLFLNRICSMRRRCQYYFAKPMSKRMRTYVKKNAKPMPVLFWEADVKTIVKPMSRWMRSRCQDACEADVMIMRSRCQGECEADVEMNAKPISRHSEIDVKTCASNLVLKQITGTHQICCSRWKADLGQGGSNTWHQVEDKRDRVLGLRSRRKLSLHINSTCACAAWVRGEL